MRYGQFEYANDSRAAVSPGWFKPYISDQLRLKPLCFWL